MRFIDNEDFIAVARRPVADTFAQLAHLVNAAIRSRVDLNHIHGVSSGHLQAACAHSARRGCRTLHAIQAARQYPGYGGFTCPALTGKNVAVCEPPLRNRILDGGSDMLLPDKLGKRLRPILPGDNLVHEKAAQGRGATRSEYPRRGRPGSLKWQVKAGRGLPDPG